MDYTKKRFSLNPSRQLKIGNVNTSEREIKDIIKAWLAISVAFAIVMSKSISSDFYTKFVIASLTVGVGFLLHEIAHKITAQRYGCFAEFRSFDTMLLLAIAMSFFGVVFAAPGAVMISGRVSTEKNGKISAAGPILNLVLALIFLVLSLFRVSTFMEDISYYGFIINSWLALFNMIPFWLFDGYKILKWSKLNYSIIVGIAFVFMILQNFRHFTE